MRKILILGLAALMCMPAVAKKKKYLETFAPEESGLNLMKITEESSNSVLANVSRQNLAKSKNSISLWGNIQKAVNKNTFITSMMGYCEKKGYSWSTIRLLAVSPKGDKLAYCTRMNGQDNVMIHNTQSSGVSTQRTFRNVGSFTWGSDNRIYFSDYNDRMSYVCSVNAEAGNLMSQLTNGNVRDFDPVLSADGKTLYFTRMQNSGPSIWALNLKNSALVSCARGFSACPIPGNNNAFYCVRNSSKGRSEIWYVDYVNGKESLVLTDENRSFTHPTLSPDGNWIACVGNSVSSLDKKNNLDIFVVRTDGSRLTQITYHPDDDTCPAWSADGKSIFFLSSRSNANDAFNVWRMNFNIE